MDERSDPTTQADPNAQFLSEQFQGGTGNDAGPLLALHRLFRWITTRRSAER